MYITVAEVAEKWDVSEQLIRRKLRQGRIPGAVKRGKSWLIPKDAVKPEGKEEQPPLPPLALKMVRQRKRHVRNGIYSYVQINLTYSSNRLASNRLERAQVEYLFRKDKITVAFEPVKFSDIVETMNHFLAVDYILDNANAKLTMAFTKKLHYLLTFGSWEDRRQLETPGELRKKADSKRGYPTTPPGKITDELSALLTWYENLSEVTMDDILAFHAKFETIHPFNDANGRVGWLIMFKECLRHEVTPFIIDDKRRAGYIKGIREWEKNDTALQVVCRESQARFERQLDFQGLIETQTYFC